MKLFFISILLASVYLLIACKSTKDSNSKIDDDTKANKVFSKTLNAHGGKLYDDAHYQFSFRDVI